MPIQSFGALAAVASIAAIEFVSAAACAAQNLPSPTGSCPVGRSTFHLVDTTRDDPQGSRKDHKREFMVQVWYPAQSRAKDKPAPWLPADWARLEEEGLLGMELRRSSDPSAKDIRGIISSVASYAVEDSPLAESPRQFPVLFFSPGNLTFASVYSSLLEELASHGFVVIGHIPTGYVTAISFPDGNVTRRYAKPDFSLWTGDLSHLLDQAEAWNKTPAHKFFGRLDLDHIGAFGHSGGANAVARIAHDDRRVRAIVLLDAGLVRPEDGRQIPTLLLNAENAPFFRRNPEEAKAIANERQEFVQKAKPGIQITLIGSEHMSFTDMAAVKAFARPGDGKAFIDTTRAVLRESFGEFLLGKHSDLIEKGSSKYPLAKVETPH
jgi:pimeloyl-ACP methyl ester carboxylesterase